MFSTKERIESVWHHESVTFNCIDVDATVRKIPGTISKLYNAVALFSDNDERFSIDVSSDGPSGTNRDQYEVCINRGADCCSYCYRLLIMDVCMYALIVFCS